MRTIAHLSFSACVQLLAMCVGELSFISRNAGTHDDREAAVQASLHIKRAVAVLVRASRN